MHNHSSDVSWAFQEWPMSRGGRWTEVNRSKASWGPQPKHTLFLSCFSSFSPPFRVHFHLEVKTDHSLLFVCYCQVRPSSQGEGRIAVCIEFSWQFNRVDGICLLLYSTFYPRLSHPPKTELNPSTNQVWHGTLFLSLPQAHSRGYSSEITGEVKWRKEVKADLSLENHRHSLCAT